MYKKDFNDPDNHGGVVTHLELDTVECEVKWALGRITKNKASGGDGIPGEWFKILKDDALKMLHLICTQYLENSAMVKGLEMVSFHVQTTIAIYTSHSKVMLKILQARLQRYVKQEFPDV